MVDQRTLQSPVRDQGDRPTCVGFAVAGAHESLGDGTALSPEDVIWAGHQVGGPPLVEMTSVQLALSGLARLNHATEDAWPYGSPPWPADRPAAAEAKDNQIEPPPFSTVHDPTIAYVEEELYKGSGLILTLGFVPAAWRVPSGVVDASPERKVIGTHAVLGVGIRVSPADREPELVIRNSWGSEWGDDGYGYVSERYFSAFQVRVHRIEAA